MNSKVEIDVIPPRNFSKGLPMREVRELFIPFIEEAGVQGKFTLRCECLQKGSAGKANTIRFKWKPASTGVNFEVIHVNFQCSKPDMCFDALLIPQDTDIRGNEIYHKLCDAHKANCFILSHRLAARKSPNGHHNDPSILWNNSDLQEAAFHRICDIAAIDKDVFIRKYAVEDVANEVFGKDISWGDGGMTDHLIAAGMLEPFDGQGVGPTMRLYVESSLFEAVGRVHPDKLRKEKGDLLPPPDPVPPATPPGDFLAQLRNARKIIADHAAAGARLQEVAEENDSIVKEIAVLESELSKIRGLLSKKEARQGELSRERDRLLGILNDPAYEGAKGLVDEIKALTSA